MVSRLCSQTSTWGAPRSSCGQSEGEAVRPPHTGRGHWNVSRAPRGWRVEGQPLRVAWSAPPAPSWAVPSPVGPQHPPPALAHAGLSTSDTFSVSAHPSLSANSEAQFKYRLFSGALPYLADLDARSLVTASTCWLSYPRTHGRPALCGVCPPADLTHLSRVWVPCRLQHPGRGSLPPVMPRAC